MARGGGDAFLSKHLALATLCGAHHVNTVRRITDNSPTISPDRPYHSKCKDAVRFRVCLITIFSATLRAVFIIGKISNRDPIQCSTRPRRSQNAKIWSSVASMTVSYDLISISKV